MLGCLTMTCVVKLEDQIFLKSTDRLNLFYVPCWALVPSHYERRSATDEKPEDTVIWTLYANLFYTSSAISQNFGLYATTFWSEIGLSSADVDNAKLNSHILILLTSINNIWPYLFEFTRTYIMLVYSFFS